MPIAVQVDHARRMCEMLRELQPGSAKKVGVFRTPDEALRLLEREKPAEAA